MGLFQRTELKQLALPPGTEPRCAECGLDKTCRSPKLPVFGSGRKRILVVTGMPTRTDERTTSRLLPPRVAAELRKNGIDPEKECWIDSAMMCRPPDGKLPAKKMVVDHCRPHLIKTILTLKPEVVILLGGYACAGVLGWLWKEDVGPVERWAGYRIPHRGINAWVCPTYLPGEFPFFDDKPQPVLDRQFAAHLKAACSLKGPPHTSAIQPDTDFCEVILDDRKAAEVVRNVTDNAIKSGMPVAFDYETTTLKPHGPFAEIYTCSIAATEEGSGTDFAFSFPWRGEAIATMKEFLADPKIKKVASNAKFEESWTRWHLKTPVRGWHRDTMLAAHALENGSKSRRITGIKFQAFAHLGVDEWDSHVKPFLKGGGGNTPNRIKQVPLHDLLVYGALDSLYELQVCRVQDRIIKEGK